MLCSQVVCCQGRSGKIALGSGTDPEHPAECHPIALIAFRNLFLAFQIVLLTEYWIRVNCAMSCVALYKALQDVPEQLPSCIEIHWNPGFAGDLPG